MSVHKISDKTAFRPEMDVPPADGIDRRAIGDRLEAVKSAAADAVQGAAAFAGTIPEQVDSLAATTGRVLEEGQRAVEHGSDEALLAGAVLTTGLAMGLLVGRMPRIVVALALVPAAAMGVSLLQRRELSLRSDFERSVIY